MALNRHKHSTTAGSLEVSTLLCGTLGLLVSGVLYWIGLLGKGDLGVFHLLSQPVFQGAVPSQLSAPILFLLTAVFCFGLAFAVLDSPGAWRRVVLGLTLLVLVIAMVPTLAVWDIYFPPMMCLVGVFWTWFVGMIYAGHHSMPCDQVSSLEPLAETGIPIQDSNIEVVERKADEEPEKTQVDLEAKYQPNPSSNNGQS